RRVQKIVAGQTTTIIYDGVNALEERNGATVTRRYFYRPGIDRLIAAQNDSGVLTYSVSDHLGSIVRETNVAGSPTATREYDPWGNLENDASVSIRGFAGREWEAEAGLN